MALVVECEDHAEIDRLWNPLTAVVGRPHMWKWLVDPFGRSWQVVPMNIAHLTAPPAAPQAILHMAS